MRRLTAGALVLFAAATVFVHAQPPQFTNAVRAFIKHDAPVIALTNARVIDGTGAPATEGQTLILRGGNIADVGDSSRVKPPEGSVVVDLASKSVIPGLVMVHEHLYYPTGPQVYGQLGQSFVRLYLAGGVTTMRTGGNVNGFMDLKLKTLIDHQQSNYIKLFPKGMALERAFAKAGGILIAGTDPTGSGGVVPGYANQRQIELLVEAGFSPVEAISIGTLNGAKYLGRDARVGTIAASKQADLVIVNGDPSTTIEDIRNAETVFRQGIGYDSHKLIQAVSGRVGLW